jgi:hypothetical protein
MGRGKLTGSARAAAFVLSLGAGMAIADSTPLYKWSLDSPLNSPGTTSTITPDITPNSLASDGGVLQMAKGTTSTFSNLYTPSGGGVSGAASDYAMNNASSTIRGTTNSGIAYSTGAAATNNVNTINALPNLTQFTITAWVKPTASEVAAGSNVQSRIMMIGGTSNYDGNAGVNGVYLAVNGGGTVGGLLQFKATSLAAGSVNIDTFQGVGSALVANTWNFIAVEVNLQSSNIYFDSAMRAASGNAVSSNVAMFQYDAASNHGAYSYQAGFASTGASGATSNGTILFNGEADYAQLMDRTSDMSRPFQGLGDNFRIYNTLLTTQELTNLVNADYPGSVPEPSAAAGLALVSAALVRRRRRSI